MIAFSRDQSLPKSTSVGRPQRLTCQLKRDEATKEPPVFQILNDQNAGVFF